MSWPKVGWILASLLLATRTAGAGKYDKEIARQVSIADANLDSRPELALAACVHALRLDRSSDAAQKCLAKVNTASVLTAAVTAATTANSAGRVDDAWEWCDAVLTAAPSKYGVECTTIKNNWMRHGQDLLILEQTRTKLQQKNFQAVDDLLAKEQNSTFPDIVSQALALARQAYLARVSPDLQLGIQYNALNAPDKSAPSCDAALKANPSDPAALQCMQQAAKLKQDIDDQKSWSVIAAAKAANANGKHDDAVTKLTTLLNGQTALSPPVRKSAEEALADVRTTSFTVFRDALKSPWIMQFLAALALVSGVWFALHLLRWIWRRIVSMWAHVGKWVRFRIERPKQQSRSRKIFVSALDKVGKIQWAFTGVQEEVKIGANDAVLDALRRVPNEVCKSIWTPGRLLLHAVDQGFEVWEDFGKAPPEKQFHEEVFSLLLNTGRAADNALADAFQNLQFNLGTVGINAAARFWRAIMDWWRDGQPGFSGVAQETQTVDGTGKQVVIRLTCSGGPYGTVSALASTRREDNVDVVALTAARAAYKLLARMTGTPETIEQIDAHAAFRQGARILSYYVRSVADPQADQPRIADLNKGVVNLEFARQVFCRDADHKPYYLESLRFEAIGYALLGKPAPALTRFEELEDAASKLGDERSRLLAIEAAFNQGVLHLAAGGAKNPTATQLARDLFQFVRSTAPEDDPIAHAADVRRVEVLASMSRELWPQLNETDCEETIDAVTQSIDALDEGLSKSTGDERRAFAVLATEARRNLAIARMRQIAAFHQPTVDRFETSPPAPLDPQIIAPHVDLCLAWFEKSDVFGSACVNALVCHAYALLLADKWRPAEFHARQALALDKVCQFACYVAAEACYQRMDKAGAQQYLTGFAPTPVTDPALCRLNRRLNPLPADAAAVACA